MGAMDWHNRYLQQARWTEQLRTYLFQKTGLANADRVLDLGCGTGAVLGTLPVKSGAAVFGLDLNFSTVKQAAIHTQDIPLTCADGAALPYEKALFDIVFCHFVLLWTSNPIEVIAEMRRVTLPGGWVLALAEPDYSGRVDYPVELATLGNWQTQSLRRQGADPEMGRKLAGIFVRAGLKHVQTGVMGGEWTHPSLQKENLEWDVIESDLANQVNRQDLRRMKQVDITSRQNGERVLFVPTFYAYGMA